MIVWIGLIVLVWMQLVKPRKPRKEAREDAEPNGSYDIPAAPQDGHAHLDEEQEENSGWRPLSRPAVFWGLSTAASVAVGWVLLRALRR